MDNQTQLDNQLADLTDALLERGHFEPTNDLAGLAQIVQQLNTLIEPESKPPPIFRARLTEALTDEWHRQHRQKKTSGQLVQFLSRPIGRYVAAAAVITLVLMVALLLNMSDNGPQTGTAADAEGNATATTDFLYVTVGVGAILLVAFLYTRFRRK